MKEETDPDLLLLHFGRNLVKKLCFHMSDEDMEDIVMEATDRFYRRYTGTKNASRNSYFYTCIRSAISSYVRLKKRRISVSEAIDIFSQKHEDSLENKIIDICFFDEISQDFNVDEKLVFGMLLKNQKQVDISILTGIHASKVCRICKTLIKKVKRRKKVLV